MALRWHAHVGPVGISGRLTPRIRRSRSRRSSRSSCYRDDSTFTPTTLTQQEKDTANGIVAVCCLLVLGYVILGGFITEHSLGAGAAFFILVPLVPILICAVAIKISEQLAIEKKANELLDTAEQEI